MQSGLSFVTFMELELHSSVGITSGVKITSELPHFTLPLPMLHYGKHYQKCRILPGHRTDLRN